ncbi:hypothetical protein NX059_009541 [Plenodomus lindquistii]|nr:hypothetical protein NX059_009541 [Plenodomus lindquistii]
MSATTSQDLETPLIHEDFLPTPVPTTLSTLCATCHTNAPQRRCSTCKNIHYCSSACQATDWPLHKTICKAYLKSLAQRPSSQHRRALFFPAESSKPVFVYLKYDEDGTPLDITDYLGGIPGADRKTVAFHNRHLATFTQISYDGNQSSLRTLEENMCIGGGAFRGPVVVTSHDPDEGLSAPAIDVDTRILGAVRNYASLRGEYRGPIFVEQPQERYREEQWKGVVEAAKKSYSDEDWNKVIGTESAGLGQ